MHLPNHDSADGCDQCEPMDVIVIERIDPARVALAGGVEDLPHHFERLVESAVLEDREDRAEFFRREAVLFADMRFFDEQERFVVRNCKAGARRDDRCGARDGVRCAMALDVPVRSLESLLLLCVHQVPALGLQLCQEGIVNRRVNEQIAVGRTSGAVIVGLADPRVPGRFGDVGGFVDHHRGVAGADAVRGFAGTIGGLDHGRAAGRDGQIADAHQLARERNARTLDALQQVFRRAGRAERRPHHAHSLVGGLPARWMRRKDHGIFTFDGIDGDPDRCHVRAGHRNQRGDDARRLAVLDDRLFRDLFDDPDALLPESVSKNPEHFPATLRLRAAHAALVDAHLRQLCGGLLVAAGPGHRAA